MPLEIVVLPVLNDNYAYLVRDEGSGKVMSLDAAEAEPIAEALDERGWGLDEIWLTHHHADHTDGVAALRERYGARVVGHVKDMGRLPDLDQEVSAGDTVRLGESQADVIPVDGHTIGHVAYHFEADKVAFTADSLMALGCGRVFEGTFDQMWESLKRLMALDPETKVYSGHNYGQANGRFAMSIEPENTALKDRIERIEKADEAGEPIVPATLAEELETNPFLRATEESVKSNVGLPGADDGAVFAEVRRRKDNF